MTYRLAGLLADNGLIPARPEGQGFTPFPDAETIQWAHSE